jgi:hypothetical protein
MVVSAITDNGGVAITHGASGLESWYEGGSNGRGDSHK